MLQDMEEKTGITPLALVNRPVLSPRLQHHYLTFQEVSRARTSSASSGPYPLLWGPFIDYCQLHQIPRSDWLWVWQGVEMFDDVWLDLQRTKLMGEIEAAKTK